jgi:hypothetical protein
MKIPATLMQNRIAARIRISDRISIFRWIVYGALFDGEALLVKRVS